MPSPVLRVAMFAAAKELAGGDHIEIELAEPMTADQVCARLGQVCPELKTLLGSCRLAVDHGYVEGSTLVDPSSDVALIPPVSGG